MTKFSLLIVTLIVSSNTYSQAEENTLPDQVRNSNSTPTDGQTAISTDTSRFSGEGELGLTVTSGNSNTENLNTKINLTYEKNKWKHSVTMQSQRVKDNNTLKVDRDIFTAKSDYTFNSTRYAFTSARLENDKFSGFNFQKSIAAGIGWHLIKNEDTLLDLEAGAGISQSEIRPNSTNPNSVKQKEEIIRIYSLYTNKITPTTSLSQEFLVLGGEDNTLSESISGLKISITVKLALKLSYIIKRNSNPPVNIQPNIQATDRTTSITLVYGF